MSQQVRTYRPRKRPLAIVIMAILLSVPAGVLLHAQTDTISGIINRYTVAKVIDDCNSSIVVRNPVGFAAGDPVLIIQMKGAEISTANDSTFGDILDYHNAGNYELATVDEVNQWTLVLHNRLARTYDVSGIVQVIRVPVYANAYVGATLTAKAWDGQTGGVLALIVTGTLTLGADIDVSGKGFRGGEPLGQSFAEGGDTSYYFGEGSDTAGSKGEGIVIAEEVYHQGRGKYANGGGGGNMRASGGGGGSNADTGGRGGKDARYLVGAVPAVDIGGRGGFALLYSNSSGYRKAFLGGGGGAGGREDQTPDLGGERGGGIVLIRAAQVDGSGHSISADGLDNTAQSIDYTTTFGGGGGGGAGGVVLLDVSTFSSSTTVSVTGGDGMNTSGTSNCIGPGGGGGGGCAWFSAASAPSNTSVQDHGGAHGISGTGTQCSGDGYGATDGGAAVTLLNLVIPSGTVSR